MNLYIAPDLWGKPSDGGAFDPTVFQGMENSCAIHAQYQVLKDFGFDGTVDELKQEAIDNGWYNPEAGTNLCDVGKLLEEHGVACDMYANCNAFNLVNELAQGKRVIVSVDSGELWSDSPLDKLFESIEDSAGVGGADHAVVVSGLDMSDPDNPMVTLTDSGSGHAAISYPLDQFTDAWRDGNCTMWVTREAPPCATCQEMENFDYALGHVECIGSSSYHDWVDEARDMLGDVAELMKVAVPVAVGVKTLIDVFGNDQAALGASTDCNACFDFDSASGGDGVSAGNVADDNVMG